ncbi:related to L-fucose permease [Rhynchosporium secalis]|uniref:Related to L-fucose permease n=1 Tax=Rhynchosporium secalis TaxID=38038 RepID=A0A1E1MUR4_RHYSE|nr:related to L-fucose permease [Rhynchosporium secalis]
MSDFNRTMPSRGRTVFVVTTITFVLASFFVIARLISRFGVLKHRTADDWVMILAWLLAFGLSFAIDFGTARGLGRHDVDIPESWNRSLRGSEYAFTILYNPALMATKTSILIFYLRMSRNTQKILRIASYVTLAIVNIAGVVLTFLNAFQCSPVSAAYDPKQSNQKCISIVTLYLCSAPVNIITDLAILVLPIPVLTSMRLPSRQKTILILTFCLGIFVTIVDVIRIYYLQQAVTNQTIEQSRLGTGVDFAWNASTALMWSAVEVNVGIICACIPTLKPLVKRILPSMLKDRSRGTFETEKSGSFSSQPPRDSNGGQRPSEAESNTGLNPLPPAHVGATQEEEMDMMGFLTVPGGMGAGLAPSNTITRTQTHRTAITENTVYFGFVNMRRPKSMLKTRGKESFKYCFMVTILFFLWGFSYGLLNTLNNEISQIAHQTIGQTICLTSAYFGAYFVGALTVGQWVLRVGGFKATFITGLCIYGIGTLMFWPSAVLTSFPGFIISNFVVGFGLAVTETAANPFLALCGPSEYAEFRLLMAQGIQASASILSQMLAEKIFFPSVAAASLIDVQWTYLAVALFTVILALFFYYMPLPEASDKDLAEQATNLGIDTSQKLFTTPKLGMNPTILCTSLTLAVSAQFLYVAEQESTSIFFNKLLESLSPLQPLTLPASSYGVIGHTSFAMGRFTFALLTLVFPHRLLLLITFVGGIIFAFLTTTLSTTGNGIAGPAVVFLFFEGPIFPMVFATGLRGLGRKTKMGASFLTAACSGGAVFPFVMLAVQRWNGKGVQYSFCVVVALLAAGVAYPIYLNAVPKVRRVVDPLKVDDILPHNGTGRVHFPPVLEQWEREGAVSRMSYRLSFMVEKIKNPRPGSGGPWVEHKESIAAEPGSGSGDRNEDTGVGGQGKG